MSLQESLKLAGVNMCIRLLEQTGRINDLIGAVFRDVHVCM